MVTENAPSEGLVNSLTTKPRYLTEELSTPHMVDEWLNARAAEGYRLVSVTPILQTNHFNKEQQSVVWITVELENWPTLP
jgi:hypothetical protein